MKHDRMCGSRCLGPMTFSVDLRGQYVTLSQGGQLASRDPSTFMNGLAFLTRTAKLDEKLCILIEECTSSWDGALRVGFTNNCPQRNSLPPASIPYLRDIRGYCVVPVPDDLCRCGVELHFWINYGGMVIVQKKDGEKYYLKANGLNLNNPLWVFIDLYGSTSAVRLLSSRRGSRTSCPVCPIDSVPGISWSSREVVRQMSEEEHSYNLKMEPRKVQQASSYWQPSLFLMQYANQTTVLSLKRHSELTRAGLGIPVQESRGIDLDWNWRELNHFICSKYPLVHLDLIGFHFAKADKHGRLCRLKTNSLKKIKKELGDNILYIIPERDIVLNEMSQQTPPSVMNANHFSSSPCPHVPAQQRQRLTSSSSYFSSSSLNSMEEMDVSTLLREFQHMHLRPTELVSLLVSRKKLLDSAKDALSNVNFPWTKIPLVTFVGEEALDCGGPRREFFRILMMEVQNSFGVFEGQPGHLFFTYDQMALEEHKYELAGKLIAWSVAHGGPGLKALDPCLYQLMCTQECQLVDFDSHLIPDADIQEKLQKISSCKTTADLHCLQKEQGDWIYDCGFPGIYRPGISIRDVPKIYSYAVRHYIYLRTSNMIHQFIKGLNAYGQFWDMVRTHWVEFLPVFTDMHEPLSRSTFRALFQIHWSKGTRKRADEEKTIHYWELVLKMIEDKKSKSPRSELHFEDILAFVTGADEVPPLGFSQKPSIHFYQPEEYGCRLPYANTCMMGLFLPRVVKDDMELYRMVLRAIRDSADFGKI